MSKTIVCGNCHQQIKKNDDLVTSGGLLKLEPFCSKCYATKEKSFVGLFFNEQPVNSIGNIVFMVFMIGMASIAPFLDWAWGSLLFGLLALITIIERVYSYCVYERHVN
ncbi:hypothetical protein JFL43_06700 [Viridibacillus sp. YIM B01967]|uniref:CXXC-20-CXXC protein n=1 Tax=Viridibacillus soli TaxID=2798301 RepID=A0ABS1H570_9BACL|nr:hypothetical protein [Viridibacillus soli]MBK3494546.1 hypothetical protein [Viridibacillus soli]